MPKKSTTIIVLVYLGKYADGYAYLRTDQLDHMPDMDAIGVCLRGLYFEDAPRVMWYRKCLRKGCSPGYRFSVEADLTDGHCKIAPGHHTLADDAGGPAPNHEYRAFLQSLHRAHAAAATAAKRNDYLDTLAPIRHAYKSMPTRNRAAFLAAVNTYIITGKQS